MCAQLSILFADSAIYISAEKQVFLTLLNFRNFIFSMLLLKSATTKDKIWFKKRDYSHIFYLKSFIGLQSCIPLQILVTQSFVQPQV